MSEKNNVYNGQVCKYFDGYKEEWFPGLVVAQCRSLTMYLTLSCLVDHNVLMHACMNTQRHSYISMCIHLRIIHHVK